MAKKPISQRIELAGGEKIKKQLQAIGKSGEKAFRQIQDAAAKAKTPGAAFAKSLQNVRRKFEDLGRAGGRLREARRLVVNHSLTL